MPEHEPWLTALFNDHLAGVANGILSMVGLHAENPARPWSTSLSMEILVVAIIVVLFAALRSWDPHCIQCCLDCGAVVTLPSTYHH